MTGRGATLQLADSLCFAAPHRAERTRPVLRDVCGYEDEQIGELAADAVFG